jgi:hypothetical protein
VKVSRQEYFDQFFDDAADVIAEKMFEDGRLGGGGVDPYEYIDHDEVNELLDEWYDNYLDEPSNLELLRERNEL